MKVLAALGSLEALQQQQGAMGAHWQQQPSILRTAGAEIIVVSVMGSYLSVWLRGAKSRINHRGWHTIAPAASQDRESNPE